MNIEEFRIDNISTYIKAERYINNGSPSGFSEINTTSPETSPKSIYKSFNLFLIHINDDLEYKTIGDAMRYLSPNSIYVHPDIIDYGLFKNINYSSQTIPVYPTASGRTVLCLNRNNFFIKLAYPKCLGRIVRHMTLEKVQSAYDVTQLLKNAVDKNGKKISFGFFREDSGQIIYIPSQKLGSNILLPLNHKNCYEYGNIFREFRPYPYIKKREFYIPFFSLFGNDNSPDNKDKHIPLLIQLFHKQSKKIEDFVLEDIIFPLCRAYFESLLYAGVELEAHAQNMLVAIDENFKINRIICRDLESAGKDIPLMTSLGIEHMPFGKYKTNDLDPGNKTYKYDKYFINHSFMFDFKLGEYIVTPILRLIHDYYNVDSGKMSNAIKDYNKHFISLLPDNFFPSDWCYYDNINWEQEGRQREYKWNPSPKYR